MDINNNHIDWIDVAKGIGIILVILGHTIQLSIVSPIYAFHMPLFFFLSGLVMKSESLNDFLPFGKKKVEQLLKPWIIILFISFAVVMLITEWRNDLSLDAVLRDLYSVNTNVFQNSSLWYLPCFFFTLIMFWGINKLYIKYSSKFLVFWGVFSIFILFIKPLMNNIPFLLGGRLPFKIDSAMIAVVFIAIAFWHKRVIFELVGKYGTLRWVFLGLFATIIFSYLNGWANINSYDFGRISLLYYPIAFLGIGFICVLSYYICRSKFIIIKDFLSFYGKNSLLIFGFQSLYIRLYLLFFNNVYNLDMTLYGNNPYCHQICSFLLVTFVMTPLTVIFFKFLTKKGFKIIC